MATSRFAGATDGPSPSFAPRALSVFAGSTPFWLAAGWYSRYLLAAIGGLARGLIHVLTRVF
jgi:hypothetical protein